MAAIGQQELAREAGVETCRGSRRRCLLHRDFLTAMERGYAGTVMSRLPLISAWRLRALGSGVVNGFGGYGQALTSSKAKRNDGATGLPVPWVIKK